MTSPGFSGNEALIVVNYASSHLIESNLVELSAQRMPIHVIIVDNYSSAAERTNVAAVARRHGWVLIPCSTNLGFAGGVNAGMREAIRRGCTSVLLLNPDARAEVAVVRALLAHVEGDPQAVVTPRIVSSGGARYFDGAVVRARDGETVSQHHAKTPVWQIDAIDGSQGDLPWLTAACVAFSCDLYRRTGPLDDRYFLYWEDVDFTYRAFRMGARLVVRRDLVAVHDEGGTQGRKFENAKSSRYYYYNCRNRLLFGALHLERAAMLRWVWYTPAASWRILKRGGRRQLVRSPMPLLATVAGSLVGLGLTALSAVGLVEKTRT